jgi:uncharacterized membrane protein YphA (DoxX/SURF4 family)
MNLFLLSLLVLTLFISSGFQKLFSITDTAKVLQSKIGGVPLSLCVLAIVGVVFTELVGSGTVLYASVKGSSYVKLSIIGLIVFTVLATLLFHMNEPSQILKNVSVIGGLLLLYDRFSP